MKKEEYMVLCEHGGLNYEVAMFKIYKKEQNTIRASYHYHQKLNKKDYEKFVSKNKNSNIRLFIDSAMMGDNLTEYLQNVDDRAKTLKNSSLLRETLKQTKDWLKLLDHANIIGKDDINDSISFALGKKK